MVEEPGEIPGGFMATYQDPGGATIYIIDKATDSTQCAGPIAAHAGSINQKSKVSKTTTPATVTGTTSMQTSR